MELRTLGRTGLKVSPLCLGAMMFGGWGNPDHDDSIKIIHKALDSGINFIDTADVYSQGESEEIVGKALSSIDRSSVVLATKVHGQMGDDPLSAGNSRRWIMSEVENSLKRLKTDYIDLYQVHRPDRRNADPGDAVGAGRIWSAPARFAVSAPPISSNGRSAAFLRQIRHGHEFVFSACGRIADRQVPAASLLRHGKKPIGGSNPPSPPDLAGVRKTQ